MCHLPPSEDCQRDLIGARRDAPSKACPLAVHPSAALGEDSVIVLGVDPHKQSHTAVAVDGTTGRVLDQRTVQVSPQGFEQLLAWGRSFDAAVWALEDCRHVSGRLERTLLGLGAEVVRVPPRLMSQQRRSARTRGKSDPIDAEAVARAALARPELPRATRDAAAEEIDLLLADRDDRVAERTRACQRLRWHLHDLGLGADLDARSLDAAAVRARVKRQLGARHGGRRVSIALALLDDIARLTRQIAERERELAPLVAAYAPALLELPGVASLTAAKLIAETGDPHRFANDAAYAMAAGVAPLDASSGRQQRHRLNRGGNRQLNLALHRIAITQARIDTDARAYLTRRIADGKTKREARRTLKRHLARRVLHLLKDARPTPRPLDRANLAGATA
jgi:transposase